jgi:glycosyltransferase involved in cell wall biosynthesis
MKLAAFKILRRAVQACGAAVDILRQLLLGPVLLLLLRISGSFFDPRYYVEQYGRGGALRRWSPVVDFAFVGAWRLRDPSPLFSQQVELLARPRASIFPPVLDHLLRWDFRFGVTAAPAAVPMAAPLTSEVPRRDRLEALWPTIAADLEALQDHLSALTPTQEVRNRLAAATRIPRTQPGGSAVQRMLEQLPERVDHLAVLPWVDVSGGSERVTERLLLLLKETYPPGRLAVIAPDVVFAAGTERRRDWHGVPLVVLNDFLPEASQALRVDMLDRMIIALRPRTLHCINSLTAWFAVRKYGAFYRKDSEIFINLYSSVRGPGHLPGGFYFDLPAVLDHVSGVIVDNMAVVGDATRDFGLTPAARSRCFLVRTPIIGMKAGPGSIEMRPPAAGRPAHALWLSRLSPEKRLDVVGAIARRLPTRRFSVYGSPVRGARLDMTWAEPPNITVEGAFGALDDLPSIFDAYLFTSQGEGMPLALLEATALGLPIVAPDVGGISEFVDDHTGWLVSGPDAIDEYVAALEMIRNNPSEAMARVQAAQRRLRERHSWDAFVEAIRLIPNYLHTTAP